MMDREKVIKGLEELLEQSRYNDSVGWNPDCDTETLEDAIALLKAQEPRVMTAEDFENNPDVDHDGFLPAWIEYRRDGDWDEYWEGQPDEWGVCKADRIVYESMRYWTSRPTDEQREATPWEP